MSTSTATLSGARYSAEDSYVNYQHGINNGEYQIIMDWSTLHNGSDYIEDNILKKFLERIAVEDIVPKIPGTFSCDVNVYFSSTCYAKVKLAVHLDRNTQIACCSPNMDLADQIKSKWENGEEHFYYNYTQRIACGTKCCKRVYHCERVQDPANNWSTKVFDPVVYTVSSCSGPTSYIDCITGLPIECDTSDECGW
jgi:hypothetical protein